MAPPPDPAPPRAYRALWISDLHLGTRGCQAARVLEFLRTVEAETLYLVGDVVDGWALRRTWHWPQAHTDVVEAILRMAQGGTEVVYIPGNHDAFARQFAGLAFGAVAVRERAVHTTADGRRLLVLHGDEFDGVLRFAPWLSRLGSRVYDATLALNTVVARVRERMGWEYWSLAGYLKDRTKRAVQYVAAFEAAVARAAAEAGADGVVCGHIHRAEVRHIATAHGAVLYANCGDWVESRTALAEHPDGRLELLRGPFAAGPRPGGDGAATALPPSPALAGRMLARA